MTKSFTRMRKHATRSFIFLIVVLCSGFYVKAIARSSGADTLVPVDTLPDSPGLLVPIAGNTWKLGNVKSGANISDSGIRDWTDIRDSFITYVRVAAAGTVRLWIRAGATTGNSKLTVGIENVKHTVTLSGTGLQNFDAGTWHIPDTGYLAIHITGLSKQGREFGDIDALLLDGTVINGRTAFVKNNDGNFFYWGRRGPSVHLNYLLGQDVQAEWFYNEVTVPPGNDVLGSYFMADGFGEGYFGMQVNSPTSRHILFSVWSPYKTDNPKNIPEDQRIQLLRKGEDVHAGEFGNEGSGGQSYLSYPWKAGETYRFLMHAVPDSVDHTVFTAYFYAPEEARWRLIASFRRPKTRSYLTHLYSFLENFMPNQGDKQRRVLFGNQWIRTPEGQWVEIDSARFTTDNTGRLGYRMDYGGGVAGTQFYLRNCGFFSDFTPAGEIFTRPVIGTPPQVDFERLP